MVPFALRSLLHDPARLAISVGGVALAIVLILVLRGIFDGTVDKATVYTERVGADLFVTQEGVAYMGLASPVLPATVAEQVAALPGVRAADSIVRLPSVVSVGGSDITAGVVGFDPAGTLGGPWSMAEGTTQIDADGAVIDETVAAEHGVTLGDRIVIANQAFVVQGLSRETNALAVGRVFFVRLDTAMERLLAPGIVNFVLVQVEEGAGAAEVGDAIEAALPGVAVLERDELVDNDRRLFRSLFGIPVNVMAVIGLLVGLLVIGLATYSAASERTRDFGVLKAIGASNGYLYRVVLQIGLLIGIAGFAVGLVLAVLAGPLIVAIAPELGVEIRPGYALQTLGIALLLSLVSSVLPVWRISRLDPKEVFS